MRFSSLVLSLAFLCALAIPALAEPVSLSKAIHDKLVRVDAVVTQSHAIVSLTLTNLTGEEVEVDPLGSRLSPGDQGYQRIGLVFAETGQDGMIKIGAQDQWSGIVNAVCRDEQRTSPNLLDAYAFVNGTVTDSEYQILKYWRDNPYLPQVAVNGVIWGTSTMDSLKQLKGLMQPRTQGAEAAPQQDVQPVGPEHVERETARNEEE